MVFEPPAGSLHSSISLLVRELSRFIRPNYLDPAVIDTDRLPVYRSILSSDVVTTIWGSHGLIQHRRTSSRRPRTKSNPLFPVNHVDRLLRHRVIEHSRRSIAIGRNCTMQMHRAWIFAYDHNFVQPHRVASRDTTCRGVHYGIDADVIRRAQRDFFRRRIDLAPAFVPDSLVSVWTAALATPPIRWKVRQRSFGPEVPVYARRDLLRAHLHGP